MTYSEKATKTETQRENRNTPMTNEEWLKQANTEQLAEFLACVEARQNADYNEETKAWVEWLKQPHSEVGK